VNCPSCGNEVIANAKFCDFCGSSLINYGKPSSKAGQGGYQSANQGTPNYTQNPGTYNQGTPNYNQYPRKLYRSRENRVLAGVCGGIGEYYNTDPNLVRLLFLILFFSGGIGIIAYLIAIMIIPESPYDPWKEPV